MNPPAQAVVDRRMPGVGAAAAVLGFVEAGIALVLVAAILLEEADRYTGSDDTGLLALVLLLLLGLAALSAVGSLLLVRCSGRALFLAAGVVELLGVVALWVIVVSEFTTDDLVDYGPGAWAAATALAVVAGISPVVRLVLVTRPTVSAWLTYRPPAEPVWSPELQQWVHRRTNTAGAVVAVLSPVLLLLVLSIIVISTQEDRVDYGFPDPPRISSR